MQEWENAIFLNIEFERYIPQALKPKINKLLSYLISLNSVYTKIPNNMDHLLCYITTIMK